MGDTVTPTPDDGASYYQHGESNGYGTSGDHPGLG